MTLPVSSYEELLARVRSLTSETIQLRREITSSLCDQPALSPDNDNYPGIKVYATHPQRTSTCEERNPFSSGGSLCSTTTMGEKLRRGSIFEKKDEIDNEFKEIDEKLASPDGVATKNASQGNSWTTNDNFGLWHSGPSSLSLGQASNNNFPYQDLASSVTCTSYEPPSLNNFSCASKRTYSHQQLGAKVEMVYSLLSMLDTDNREDMSKTFLAMSSSPESCHAMRQSGCLPLLIQLIHSSELNGEVRNRAAEALHNIVHAQNDEKRRRREVRVLKLLQQVREYCDELRNGGEKKSMSQEDSEKHPINAIGTLMKFSFDAEHRQAICTLGGLYAITDLIQVDHEAHGSASEDSLCITLRRYAGMSLTNLTFGDGKNKALLCSFNKFMRALVEQLRSPSEELRQVTASVLRNLSWRADEESKQVLRNVGAVTALTVSAMEGKKESTLKSILSALWNLSAHCSLNKVDISSVPGALAFLVKMLRYKSPSNTLAIVENAGGILRNISSHIAVREDYRQILRDNNCFEVLLEQLKSPSLTIVSNACGTLWNLSARCPEDQKKLWEMGATTMLRSLIQSKHKMISMGSSAALKNLLAANPNKNFVAHLDSTAKSLGIQNLPTLFVRKKKALEQELNITLAETCENIEGIGSPSHSCAAQNKIDDKNASGPKRSDSRDSVRSTQSDSVYERINQIVLQNQEKLLENNNITLHGSLSEKTIPRKLEEQKLIKRYKTSMIPLPAMKKSDQDRINEQTKSYIAEDCFKEDSKQKVKKNIPVLKTRLSNQSTSGLDTNYEDGDGEKTSPISGLKLSSNATERGRECEEKRKPNVSECVTQKNKLEEITNEGQRCESRNEVPSDIENDKYLTYKIKSEPNHDTSKNIQQGPEGRGQILASPSILNVEIGGEAAESTGNQPMHSFLTRKEHFASDCEKTNVKEVGHNQNEIDNVETSGPKLNLLPNFKVGSPITDSKVLQYEATKICREIKKHQDLDMGCSLTSEVSLVSCSSFLDATECSLLECSSIGVDFDEFENQQLVKGILNGNNFNLPKTTGESVSLPSLGSMKNEQIEALELDNSVLSITSFTSEVADVEVKDVNFDTYTKTCKNEDCQEQTIEDSSFPDGDETLNADSLQNNGELYDDDSSLLCQENLPLDSEVVEDETITKKLTPKEKRKMFSDRYRTYTVKDFKPVKPSLTLPEVKDERKCTGIIPTSGCFEEKPFEFSLSTAAYRETRVDLFPFSKSFDQVQNSFPVGMSDSKSLNDLLSIGPEERKELVNNAKLVAFSLKTAVHDYDTEIVSDSEADELQSLFSINTATYSKNNRPTYSPEELKKLQSCESRSAEELDKKGAKILKSEEKLESPKGVRGRRKPLYSSQKTFRPVNPSLPKCSSKSGFEPKLFKPTLHREETFTKEEGLAPKKMEAKTIKTIPVLNRNSEFKSCIPKPGGRNMSVPALGISGASKGTRQAPTKINDRRNESDPIQRRFVSTGNANKTAWHGTSARKATSANMSSQNIRPSLSSQNIKTSGSPGLRPKSAPLQALKSQSDANLHLATSKDKVAAGKPKTPKKEATSKIASLWKKVEETKQKGKNVKDKRLWIGPEKSEKIPDDVLVIEQEEIVEIPRQKIIYSHTYQSLTDETSAREQKDFWGEGSSRTKNGNGRRNVVSAVVQPYNYNPPTLTQTTSADLKNVDVFHKGSMKVNYLKSTQADLSNTEQKSH